MAYFITNFLIQQALFSNFPIFLTKIKNSSPFHEKIDIKLTQIKIPSTLTGKRYFCVYSTKKIGWI